jgi:uncharacterized repeat protein (TIGR01451 family)
MRRRTAVILAGLAVLVSGLVLLGGAATSRAGQRTIDPFTVSASPSPAQLGKHVSFTIFFKNSSTQTLTQATYHGTASAGATFDSYTASRGTCAVNASDPATVDCNFGHLESGAEVTATFRYNTPAPATGATSMQFSSSLLINERGGDPGRPSMFHPTGDPIQVGLEQPSANKVADVFTTAGGSAATDPVTRTNLTSTSLTTPGTGAFEPIVVSEGANDPTICGSSATPVLDTSTIDAPGTFSASPLAVVLDLNANAASVPLSSVVGCHNGFTLLLGCPAVIPAQGCLQSRARVRNEVGTIVYRLTMLAPTNGKWGGGF